MKALRENNTPIISITRCSDSTVVSLSDYTLYTAANETIFRSGAMASRISQLNTIDILYTAFANVDYEKNIRQFSRPHIYRPGVRVKVDGREEGQAVVRPA